MNGFTPYGRLELPFMAHFRIKFRTLASKSCWNELALRSAFMSGLFEEIKDQPEMSPSRKNH